MKINDQTLYLTDNGRALCGEHLGTSAKFTGRDISGQRIEPVTPEMAAEAASQGWAIRCENPRCGRTPSRLHTAGV